MPNYIYEIHETRSSLEKTRLFAIQTPLFFFFRFIARLIMLLSREKRYRPDGPAGTSTSFDRFAVKCQISQMTAILKTDQPNDRSQAIRYVE